jgi:hypothetical protein
MTWCYVMRVWRAYICCCSVSCPMHEAYAISHPLLSIMISMLCDAFPSIYYHMAMRIHCHGMLSCDACSRCVAVSCFFSSCASPMYATCLFSRPYLMHVLLYHMCMLSMCVASRACRCWWSVPSLSRLVSLCLCLCLFSLPRFHLWSVPLPSWWLVCPCVYVYVCPVLSWWYWLVVCSMCMTSSVRIPLVVVSHVVSPSHSFYLLSLF